MFEMPLQLVDDFLRQYHVGHALLVGFVLAVVGGFAINRSVKVLGIQLSLFGILFIVTPTSTMEVPFLFLGIGLAVIGPVVAVSGND
ncbi:hypothetical protein [Natronomonas gomsonensis]|uniref:hypothetical protein n=1 Tax=Natronomonas gomsonensis TaxID=1046043 RepID=UPI001C4C4B46|nr:hypothetical protein [Natronomonas gomsonensis]